MPPMATGTLVIEAASDTAQGGADLLVRHSGQVEGWDVHVPHRVGAELMDRLIQTLYRDNAHDRPTVPGDDQRRPCFDPLRDLARLVERPERYDVELTRVCGHTSTVPGVPGRGCVNRLAWSGSYAVAP